MQSPIYSDRCLFNLSAFTIANMHWFAFVWLTLVGTNSKWIKIKIFQGESHFRGVLIRQTYSWVDQIVLVVQHEVQIYLYMSTCIALYSIWKVASSITFLTQEWPRGFYIHEADFTPCTARNFNESVEEHLHEQHWCTPPAWPWFRVSASRECIYTVASVFV